MLSNLNDPLKLHIEQLSITPASLSLLQEVEVSRVELGRVQHLHLLPVNQCEQVWVTNKVQRVYLMVRIVETVKLDGVSSIINVAQLDQSIPREGHNGNCLVPLAGG